MFEVVAAFLIVLSAGIFVAHALDAYRSVIRRHFALAFNLAQTACN